MGEKTARHHHIRRYAPDTIVRGPQWMSRALCRGYDPDLWFPHNTDRASKRRQALFAVSVCNRCPVMAECRSYAEDLERRRLGVMGIWGGRVFLGPWGK